MKRPKIEDYKEWVTNGNWVQYAKALEQHLDSLGEDRINKTDTITNQLMALSGIVKDSSIRKWVVFINNQDKQIADLEADLIKAGNEIAELESQASHWHEEYAKAEHEIAKLKDFLSWMDLTGFSKAEKERIKQALTQKL